MSAKDEFEYWLRMTYPSNEITLHCGERKVGRIKEEDIQKMITEEEYDYLTDTGYQELDWRTGSAIEKFIKTGEFKLKKPIIHIQKAKYVKESLNEDTGITRTDEIQNREVAQEILANKEELRQEYERGVYISIIAIAKKVRDGNTFENAFNKYISEVGWFEHPNVQAKKKNYFDLLEICSELGFFIGDELDDMLRHEADLMKESLNENLSSDNPWIQQFIEENGYEDGMDDIVLDDLAYFIDQNWEEITGLSNREKDDEGYFPGEVEEIIDELELDMDDFSQAWASVREGAEDWEDEDDDEDREYSPTGNTLVNCARCGKEVKYGNTYDWDLWEKGKEGDICMDCTYDIHKKKSRNL